MEGAEGTDPRPGAHPCNPSMGIPEGSSCRGIEAFSTGPPATGSWGEAPFPGVTNKVFCTFTPHYWLRDGGGSALGGLKN